MNDWWAAGLFVLGWFAWAFGVVAGTTWVIFATGNAQDPNPWLVLPLMMVGAGLVFGGLLVGLRLLSGEWPLRR